MYQNPIIRTDSESNNQIVLFITVLTNNSISLSNAIVGQAQIQYYEQIT